MRGAKPVGIVLLHIDEQEKILWEAPSSWAFAFERIRTMVSGITEISERPWGEILQTVKLMAEEEYHSDCRAA